MKPIQINVLLGSIREGNMSSHVAREVHRIIGEYEGVQSDLIDLGVLELPFLTRKVYSFEDEGWGDNVREYWRLTQEADALVVVIPEYKHGIPGVFKNALDLLPGGAWSRKPVAAVTVTGNPHGGLNCQHHLPAIVAGSGGLLLPSKWAVGSVNSRFDKEGNLLEENFGEGNGKPIFEELIWLTRAIVNANN